MDEQQARKSAKRAYDAQRFSAPDIKERRRVSDRRWRAANPAYMRVHSLKTLYGLTLHEADQMFARGCGICGCELTTEKGQGNTFNVDHDHVTGVVRGGLCFRCNVALGRVDAVPGWLEKAQKYIADAAQKGVSE